MADKHLIHARSLVVTNGKPKLPLADRIEYGELAVNYAKDYETISLKNNNNEIVTFSSDDAIKQIINDEVTTITSTINNLSDVVANKVDKMISKTYSQLKSMRDNSELEAGQLYRITDYVTTTTQTDTQSANNAFDIVVTIYL